MIEVGTAQYPTMLWPILPISSIHTFII